MRDTASTLAKLDDALSVLERRMGLSRSSQPQAAARPNDGAISEILQRQQAISRRGAQSSQPRREAPAAAPQAAPAQPQIAAEIAKLREELNREMSTSLSRQFDGLRAEMKSLGSHAPNVSPSDLSDGFDRITRELGLVASRVGNDDMGSLRTEVEELKQHVSALAREDTLRDMAERWGVIEREIAGLPQTLGSRDDLMTIADRIGEMNTALHALPDSVAIGAMEDQVRMLAEAVEQLARQNASISPDNLASVESRLDEITQAIVAVQMAHASPQIDNAPFERIEARISTLARQVEEQAVPARSDSLERKLREITDRLDTWQDNAPTGPQDGAFDAVTARLDEIARRFDAETQPAAAASQDLFDSLHSRFQEITDRLESNRVSAEESGARMFQSLDARMEELARRIEDNERESATVPGLDHMERRIEEIAQMLSSGDVFGPPAGPQIDSGALQNIEDQISALSERLAGIQAPSLSPELADLGPRLVAISEHLSNGREDVISAAREAAEEVIKRLPQGGTGADHEALSQLTDDLRGLESLARNADDRNERTFEAIHDTLIKVADHIHNLETNLSRQDAPRPHMPAAAVPAFAAGAMAGANAEDDFPHEAFGQEPYGQDEPYGHDEPKYEIEDAPSLDFAADRDRESDDHEALPEKPLFGTQSAAVDVPADMPTEMPADMSARGPESEIPEEVAAPQPKGKPKSLLGGLRSALSRGTAKPAVATASPVQEGAGESMERIEPDLSDEPLEPGSGAPDLAAIMQRVRAERGEGGTRAPTSHASDDDSGKSDFIAAARRAARAAAAEASVMETGNSGKGGKKGKKAGGLFPSRRRTLMIGAGALLLALLALPLVRGFLSGGPAPSLDVARVEDPAAVAPEPVAPEPVAPKTAEPTKPAAQAAAAPAKTAAKEPASQQAAPKKAPVPPRNAEINTASAALTSSAPTIPMETGETVDDGADTMDTVEQPAETVSLEDIPADIGPVALREAAADGDPKAIYVIGERLTGSAKDPEGSNLEAAARWYEASAESGYAPAQYRLGNFYEKGLGVERDIEAAKMWYKLAAEQGNASAMHNLAVLFATQIDGKRDMVAAGRWFLEAAELGVRDSQVNLGILSARGEGVPQDLKESYKWLALAARSGDSDAQAKRDEVAGFMQPDQLEMARGAVELWKPKPVDPEANALEIPEAWKVGKEVTASATSAPADAAPLPDEQMKRAVRNIQAILNNNGFDAGPPDGIMGDKTRSAIIAFQEANGLVPNGEVDGALVDKLLEMNGQT